MADKQISQLTAGTIDNNADSFMFDDADGYTYKLPYSDLAGAVLSQSLGAGTGINITTDTSSTLYKKTISIDADTTPTQYSSKPITSGGVYAELSGKQDTLTIDSSVIEDSTNPVEGGAVYAALEEKQDVLIIDSVPTENSTNPVESGGVYTALTGKQNTLTFDQTPTQNSSNPVTSGGVWAAIQGGGGGGTTKTLIYNKGDSITPDTSIVLSGELLTNPPYTALEIEYIRLDDSSSGQNIAYANITTVRLDTLSHLNDYFGGNYNWGIVLQAIDNSYNYYTVYETTDDQDNPITQLDLNFRSSIPAQTNMFIYRIWGVS